MIENIGKALCAVAACLVGVLAVMVVALKVVVGIDAERRGWR